MLYDLAHRESLGRYTDGMDCGISVPELLEEWGCSVDLNHEPLDQVNLSQYDLLVIYSPWEEFSPAERAAIEEYVRRGGSLLLLADTQFHYGNRAPNQVAGEFGAGFDGDEVEACRISAPYHPIAFDLDDGDLFNPFLLWDAYVNSTPKQAEVVVRSQPGARALAAAGNESIRALAKSGGSLMAMVAFRHGLGKVVLGPRNGLGQPTGGPWYNRPGEENRVLAATVKWLTDKDSWLVRLIYDYFPVLMFSRGERWYPTSFYFDGDADLMNNYENYHEGAPYYVYVHVANATIVYRDNCRWVGAPQWSPPRCDVVEREGIAVEYWFYSVYNYHPGRIIVDKDVHEHEWESVFVFFTNESGQMVPVGVRYNRHKWPRSVSWDDLREYGALVDDTHPIVHVANGSHASYAPFESSRFDKWYPGGLILSWEDLGDTLSMILMHARKTEVPGSGKLYCVPSPLGRFCTWVTKWKVMHETLNGSTQSEMKSKGLWLDKFVGNNSEKVGWLYWYLSAPWAREAWSLAELNLGYQPVRLNFFVACPVDLHIYDPLGRHVGLNYTTGELELQIPNATYEVSGNVTHVMIDWAMDGEYRIELVARGSGNYTFLAVESVGGVVTDYVVETGNVTEGENITYKFSTANLNATLSFLPGEVRPRMPTLANVTLVNSGTVNITWVNVTHLLPEGYVRYVDHASAFLEVNGSVYLIHPRDVRVEAEGSVVRVYLNFTSGVRLIGPGGVREIHALEPGWVLRLYYLIRPSGYVEPGSHESTVIVEYLQEFTGAMASRLSTASAELMVRSGRWCP